MEEMMSLWSERLHSNLELHPTEFTVALIKLMIICFKHYPQQVVSQYVLQPILELLHMVYSLLNMPIFN